MRCTITAHEFQYIEIVEVNEMGGAVIGRADEITRFMPDVDLTLCSGRERGVSRRHAALVLYGGTLHLIDLQSVNGTFLGDVMLSPNRPYPLKSENQIRLGTLDLKLIIS
jgi:pSer/pThr/pTyr-binding forkhead associated (FHA) protein